MSCEAFNPKIGLDVDRFSAPVRQDRHQHTQKRTQQGDTCDQISGGHQVLITEEISLVKVTKKLVCSKCGSKAVNAYRYLDNDLQAVFPNSPYAGG